ncbi:MAG: ATP-binding cassette domain-containing protein [Mesorhizobium sp.]
MSTAPLARAAAAAETPRIAVQNLKKSFGRLPVLHGVSLSAPQGSVISLVGSSGSGKSTLLRCINLLEVPDSGDIQIDGETLHFDPAKPSGGVQPRQIRRIRSSLGMVFQSFNLWSHMTILENVIAAPVHVLGQPRGQAVERAHDLLKRVGIADKHDFFPAQLSGGQQQRAAIARAMAIEPKALLLDEPTSALDPELVAEVLQVIKDLAIAGTTMILVTHEMRFAREVSSTVVFLHRGVVGEMGPPAQIFDDPQTEACRRFVRSEFGA